jgi:hypothetical protein
MRTKNKIEAFQRKNRNLTDEWRSAASHGFAAHRFHATPPPTRDDFWEASWQFLWEESRDYKIRENQSTNREQIIQ